MTPAAGVTARPQLAKQESPPRERWHVCTRVGNPVHANTRAPICPALATTAAAKITRLA
jgi:hypothetical protein